MQHINLAGAPAEDAQEEGRAFGLGPMTGAGLQVVEASDAWARQAQQAAAAAAWEWNLRTGAVTWSDAYYALHGLDPERTTPGVAQWLDLLHPSDRGRIEAEARRFLRDEARQAVDVEFRILRDGETRWMNARGCVVRDAQGRRAALLGLTLDVTARRRLERDALALSAREQQRVGYELHDELCQQLTGIHIKSQVLFERLRADQLEHAEYLERIMDMVDAARVYTRNLSRTLTPVLVQHEDLSEALRQLAADTSRLLGITCELLCPEPPEEVDVTDDHAATQLYRITQEAVHLAVKQRGAHRVTVRLAAEDGRQGRLRIEDNGAQSPPAVPAEEREAASDGAGPDDAAWRAMHYRAATIGAALEIRTRPGGEGAAVECLFPLHPSDLSPGLSVKP